MNTRTLRNAISVVLFALATGLTGLALAQETTIDTTRSGRTATTASQVETAFDLPAGKLAAALNAFGMQSGLQMDYPPELVASRQARAVLGYMTWREALTQLLEESGLEYEVLDSRTVAIRRAAGQARAAGSTVTTSSATHPAPAATNLESVQVTGTRIRGGSSPSPVITIGSEQIQQEGFADLGEVIRSVPQNFSGGQNPGVAPVSGGPASNQNITGGSGMNLRGLGPDATLTLINGRRMSYGGFSQSVDISAIPVEAVERIEIVPDGASAVYGSDAVGGVANVILKPDFDGVTLGTRYGDATEGGLTTREYTATAGTTWATGGLIAAVEKTSNDPIYSDQRDYTRSMYRPSTLWQDSNLRSGLFSLHQSLGEAVELHLDALGDDRDSRTSLAYPSVYHPYDVKTRTTLLAPSLEIGLPDDWTLTLSGAVGQEKNSVTQQTVSRVDEAIIANSPVAYRNKSLTYEIGAEGPLFTLLGGEARLATGAGYRYNDYLYLIGHTIGADGDESSRFAYVELNLPLLGPEQSIGGIERLELTGAVRTEDGDYGRVTTPKFGVIYSPSVDFSLKASWGKSFKAPTLSQRYFVTNALYYTAATFGGTDYPTDAAVLALSGGNPDLHPERARTWSASLALHPEVLPQLEMELNWFEIDYTQRVVLPIANTDVLGNPIYADFVDYEPTEAAQAIALANAGNFYNYVGTPYDASKVVAIIDDRSTNASRQRIKGIDLSGMYRFDLGAGRLTVRGSASWLDSTQALTAAQSSYHLAGTLFNPARLSSRIGAVWQQGGFTASLFGNYKSGVINTADDKKSASFTTFDATLRYDTGARDDAWSNLRLELSTQNLLNHLPPLYTPISPKYTPYDSTNYSAVGRFVSLSVSKHW
ncbi:MULTISPECIES: TonB-dependent receptor [Rhodanobacter]|uniref:TonB-dependent receptor n=1 Tax=Rhodanobacter TaxID=75309 RepID=UPI000412BFAC|nr:MULTISPECIES: TonB-dependent receptor [Rhodanobacter]KZC21247.1 TonB-dependent receptor [Rhodanobacter denitrificans]UJJ51506.1 TonB-dependent receptor [Rhodanobacter denitrificans]UJJ59713.1 TonB-dependent receptor [Rhodanobacter denitrificans]UJM94251.1 TonB-dependent receptor [Rhodanobacter denitrificans]UJM97780.1 TonB-dependent receptor [Rhodanobacter denitrificans]